MERFVTAIYCEDIRQEVGNKRSLMGIFSGTIFVNEFPVTLLKLCISIQLTSLASNPVKTLTLKVLKNDEELSVSNIDESAMSAALSASPCSDETPIESSRIIVGADIALLNLKLDGPTKFKIRALTESGELKGPTLEVKLLPNGAVASA